MLNLNSTLLGFAYFEHVQTVQTKKHFPTFIVSGAHTMHPHNAPDPITADKEVKAAMEVILHPSPPPSNTESYISPTTRCHPHLASRVPWTVIITTSLSRLYSRRPRYTCIPLMSFLGTHGMSLIVFMVHIQSWYIPGYAWHS